MLIPRRVAFAFCVAMALLAVPVVPPILDAIRAYATDQRPPAG